MRHNHYTTTALALLFGLGVAVAGAPASAAGDWTGGNIVVAQAGGGGGGGTGGTGTGSGSDESGATHPMERSAANPVLEMQCDADNDGFVDTDEARACYRQRFGTISGGVGSIDEERFSESMTGMEDAPGTFAQIDADGDGEISEAEWEAWQERRFGAATAATGGRMAIADYERYERGEDLAAVAAAPAADFEPGFDDIVAQLRESGEFTTFVRAIEAAGLVEELKDAGPFTVFAPTDEAFNQLPQGALDQLMQAENADRLEELVKHHLVLGSAHPADALPETLDPMEGDTLNVGIADSGAVLRPEGGEQVAITRDILADNGYIQVIDSVLVPQQLAQTLQTGQQQGQQQAQQAGQQQQAQQGQQQATAAQQQATAAQPELPPAGEITPEEWTKFGDQTFAAADTDQSGFIDEEEFLFWAEEEAVGADEELFGLFDDDDDGQVSQEEWFDEDSFTGLDENDSGVLDEDEFGV